MKIKRTKLKTMDPGAMGSVNDMACNFLFNWIVLLCAKLGLLETNTACTHSCLSTVCMRAMSAALRGRGGAGEPGGGRGGAVLPPCIFPFSPPITRPWYSLLSISYRTQCVPNRRGDLVSSSIICLKSNYLQNITSKALFALIIICKFGNET